MKGGGGGGGGEHLSIKANSASERFAIVSGDSYILARPDLTDVRRKIDVVTLMASEAKRVSILTRFKAQGNDSHSHQVTPMDSLKALCNHRLYTLLIKIERTITFRE
jgi:hypothetical protein